MQNVIDGLARERQRLQNAGGLEYTMRMSPTTLFDGALEPGRPIH